MTLKNKIHLSIAIFSLITIFCAAFLIFPLFQEIKKEAAGIVSFKKNLAFLETEAESFGEFKNSYLGIESDLGEMNTLFVDSEVPIDFIGFLEKTARDCHAQIKISPALPAKIEKESWPFMIFQIASVSSFPNFLKFLEKLESSNYLMEVQNLNIARLSEAELKSKGLEKFSLGDVQSMLTFKVYTK